MNKWHNKEESMSRAVVLERLESEIIYCEDRGKAVDLLLAYRDLIVLKTKMEMTLEQLEEVNSVQKESGDPPKE